MRFLKGYSKKYRLLITYTIRYYKYMPYWTVAFSIYFNKSLAFAMVLRRVTPRKNFD